MLYFFYNLLILLTIPIVAGSLVLRMKYRKGFLQRIGIIPKEVRSQLKGSRPVWLHAVSVGEVIASIPIIKKIKQQHPNLKIVLSTITNTGNYTARQKIPELDSIIFFPYDYLFIVNRVISIINPCIFIHTETEIWPNFLWALERHRISSVIINGRISKNSSRRYKMFGWFFKKVFNKVSIFGMQSSVDYQRVLDMGVDPKKILLTGNMKFDQSNPDFTKQKKNRLLNDLNLSHENKVLIAGSTHSGEEEIILNVFKQLIEGYPQLVLILAPRHPERFHDVEKLVKERGLNVIRKTQITKKNLSLHSQVILLDTIGELSIAYGLGDVIFVGGSLVDIGGHNILEPLVYKKPVIFGSYMQNFSDIARLLIESEAGILVKTKEDLLSQAEKLLRDEKTAKKLGKKGFAVIRRHQGATEKNMEIINRFIKAADF